MGLFLGFKFISGNVKLKNICKKAMTEEKAHLIIAASPSPIEEVICLRKKRRIEGFVYERISIDELLDREVPCYTLNVDDASLTIVDDIKKEALRSRRNDTTGDNLGELPSVEFMDVVLSILK